MIIEPFSTGHIVFQARYSQFANFVWKLQKTANPEHI